MGIQVFRCLEKLSGICHCETGHYQNLLKPNPNTTNIISHAFLIQSSKINRLWFRHGLLDFVKDCLCEALSRFVLELLEDFHRGFRILQSLLPLLLLHICLNSWAARNKLGFQLFPRMFFVLSSDSDQRSARTFITGLEIMCILDLHFFRQSFFLENFKNRRLKLYPFIVFKNICFPVCLLPGLITL